MTELRRRMQEDLQLAGITTAQKLGNTVIASRMFSRWCQENFFVYMMQHYDIDGLVDYGSESLPGSISLEETNSSRTSARASSSLLR